MNSFVRRLDEVKENDIQLVGGKAANLARLIKASLPVPPGIVVGLNAFDSSGTLNQDAKEQIQRYIRQDKLYAVRSSALAEDADGASWAGQFETFLDTKSQDVIEKIEECHNSAKSRAKAYAKNKGSTTFDIAVVVQEMLKPAYSGVLFTKDPLTGNDLLVTEYIKGLGEELVSGKADPKRIVLGTNETSTAPFDTTELAELANKARDLFGTPQDIEWAWADNKMWLVQARPITATGKSTKGYYLGEPSELFYWGPARTKPMYMSDWLAGCEQVFIEMSKDADLPTPPKTLVLFCDRKMVFLCNAKSFSEWCERSFEVYKTRNQIEDDIEKWREIVEKLPELSGLEFSKAVIKAWAHTIVPEFSLYGAENSIVKYLQRFDSHTKQEIWAAFTIPDKPTFLSRIDMELASTRDPKAMAEKYSWIQDGYDGLAADAEKYFQKRLKIVGNDTYEDNNNIAKRDELTKKLKLTEDEINALTLTRKLAEFMDDRKAWMMQTRRLIKHSVGNIEHGWLFNDGVVTKIDANDTKDLWQRYVDFKASTSAVVGIVASNGGKHFINGEVAIVTSPTEAVDDGKIVVVPSTSPSYVPLMRKAKALVTDHGGMMSHAAIVAREFNLPCIVGTKQATKVLKNGDKVVLDLVKGEVNK